MAKILRILCIIGVSLGVLVLLLASLIGYWALRPNRAVVSDRIVTTSWDAVRDGAHNSNTDLIYWRNAFYLVHASSPWHFASEKCRLILWRSEDATHWERITELSVPGEDIRDPKFASIGDRFLIYALKNTAFPAEPYTTVLFTSPDGQHWSPFREIQPEGWLFWRPKTADGVNWYVPAYWHKHGRAILLRSTDGENWSIVSQIHEGERMDETDIEFLPDGRLLATGRLEGSGSFFGDAQAGTLLSVASPPFERWTTVKSRTTRLDGPALFLYNGRVYAVGRYQPNPRGPFTELGSIFSRKRTSLFLVTERDIFWLTDLPSAGDTSYAGVVVQGDTLYISYYTSDPEKDYPWVLGMVAPSSIRIARVSLPELEKQALSALAGAR